MTTLAQPTTRLARVGYKQSWLVHGLGMFAALLVGGLLASQPGGMRLSIAVAVIVLFVGLGLVSPKRMLFALVVWLVALGLVRRLVSGWSPAGEVDPLLIVGPAALTVLALVAAERQAFRDRRLLANAVLALQLLILLGAVNPLQGSLFAGLAGLLFVFVPTLAFWVGRGMCDDRTLAGVLKLVALLAVLVAIYGLVQTLSGFPSWDAAWIRASGYGALSVGGVIRSFGSFPSASEYAWFLAVGVAAWLAYGLKPGRLPLTAAAVALVGASLFLASSRSVIFTLAAALTVMLVARSRLPLLAGLAAGAAAIVLLSVVASWAAPSTYTSGALGDLSSHQLEGLANPLDPNTSTLGIHAAMAAGGLRSAIANPIGLGTGSITIAADKFGGLPRGTETDPSNVAVALGLPGLVAYSIVFVAGLVAAYRLAARRRDALGLAAVALLVITLFQWLNGGHYLVAVLSWLVLGWVDRPEHHGEEGGP